MTGDSSKRIAEELARAPGGSRAIDRLLAGSYAKFVEVLHADLNEASRRMEGDRGTLYGLGEDQLTLFLKVQLEAYGYDVEAGAQRSGSVDLTVKRRQFGWTWIAEAKILPPFENAHQGFLQLTTRYSSGDSEDARGGLIVYVKADNAASKIKNWRRHLERKGHQGLAASDCPHRPNLAFYTKHLLQSTGLPMLVRHMGMALFFKPEDKSGLKAAKYRPMVKTAKRPSRK